MEEKDKKRKSQAIVIIAVAACIVTIASTAAYFVANITARNQEATITTGTMSMTFSDNSPGITAELNFGESVTKDFKIQNTGTLPVVAVISWDDLVNTYLAESLQYTLSYSITEGGTYTDIKTSNVPRSETSSKIELANDLSIPAGATYYYRLTITLVYSDTIDQTADLNASFSTRFTIDEGRVGEDTYLVNVSGLELEVNRRRPNFATVATTDEGVFAMEDNYGTSYYYRGAVENNYVKFADYFWRIIRVNGDGSLRMIYDGTSAHENGESSTDRSAIHNIQWNETNNNDAKYVGYMYGGANGEASTSKELAQTNETSSNIKTELESWYKTNIEDRGYEQYLTDVIFCNDRSTASTSKLWWKSDSAQGFGNKVTAFGAYERFFNASTNSWDRSNATPTFICPTNNAVLNNNDWFTAEATTENKGNGALDYPIGIITLDESVAAGGKINFENGSTNNSNFYLKKGHWYWTFSPKFYNGATAHVYGVFAAGQLSTSTVNSPGAVAPVINLSAETAKTLIGDGTIGNEYRLPETT